MVAVGVILLDHDPLAEWPPLFNSPWLSSSPSDFWNRRWQVVFAKSITFFTASYLPSKLVPLPPSNLTGIRCFGMGLCGWPFSPQRKHCCCYWGPTRTPSEHLVLAGMHAFLYAGARNSAPVAVCSLAAAD